MHPLLALIGKDLRLHVHNRRALILTLAVPIAIASFFGSLFGGQSGRVKPSGVPVAVVDLDHSAVSAQVLSNLLAEAGLRVSFPTNEAAAQDAVRQGHLAAAVVIPANFGRDAGRGLFGGGAKPDVVLYEDPGRQMESGLVRGLLTQHIISAVARNVFNGASGRQFTRDGLARIEEAQGMPAGDRELLRTMLGGVDRWLARVETNRTSAAGAAAGAGGGGGGFSLPFNFREEPAVREAVHQFQYNGYAHSFGGMSMQFVLMAAIDWGLAILLERQRGLWRRLRAAPISRGTLLAGRAASSALIGLATLTVCWGFSMVVFHVRVLGSWPGFVLCNLAVAVFAASLGLFIAAVGRTPEATRGLAIFVILILVMLGGAWIPSFIFPEWLQQASVVIPTRWAMEGFDGMTWRGLGFAAAVKPVLVLLFSSLVCGGLAWRWFRWEAD